MTTDAIPGTVIESEHAVASAVLTNPSVLDVVRDLLEPFDCFDLLTRRVLESAYRIDDSGEAVDPVSVMTDLQGRGHLSSMGGSPAIAELTDGYPYVTDVASHCRAVADKARLRRIVDAARIITGEGAGQIDDVEAWAQRSEQRLFDASADRCRNSSATETLAQLLPRVAQDMQDRCDGGEAYHDAHYVPVPWRAVKQIFPAGLMRPKFHVVAGRPGMGKSVFCSELMRQVCGPQCGGLLFSLEMTKLELTQRMLAAESKRPLETIMTGEPDSDDWRLITTATERLSMLPIAIRYRPGATVATIRSTIRREAARMRREQGVDLSLVVVDYLQLVNHARQRGDTQETAVANTSKALMTMAGEFDVALVGVSQLNRSLEGRPNKHPVLSDLRESGAIEQDAYSVNFLYRDEYYREDSPDKGICEVITAKHRNGRTGTARLKFTGQWGRFDNIGGDDGDFTDLDAPTNYQDVDGPY
jgi:replicative DNA helicase